MLSKEWDAMQAACCNQHVCAPDAFAIYKCFQARQAIASPHRLLELTGNENIMSAGHCMRNSVIVEALPVSFSPARQTVNTSGLRAPLIAHSS